MELANSFNDVDILFCYTKRIKWDFSKVISNSKILPKMHNEIEDLVEEIVNTARTGDIILIMSNGSFDNIHEKLINKLKNLNNVND